MRVHLPLLTMVIAASSCALPAPEIVDDVRPKARSDTSLVSDVHPDAGTNKTPLACQPKPLKTAEMLHQQDCLAYEDKQGDLSLALVSSQIPGQMLTWLVANLRSTGRVERPQEHYPPDFLNRYPFDINPHLDTPERFIPNAAQHLQLELPGYQEWEELNRDRVIVGNQNPIKLKQFGAMLLSVIHKTGISPFVGPTHKLAASKADYARYLDADAAERGSEALGDASRFLVKLGFRSGLVTKLFVTLGAGMTSRYLFTGRERELMQYILSRPDGSVQIHELFEASYRQNVGDVYLTLLTIENVLSRWYVDPQRAMLAINRKLANITNSYYGRDDRFGAWYHMFGLALLAFAERWTSAISFAYLVAELQSASSMVLNILDHNPVPNDDGQENHINRMGARVGIDLAIALKRFEESKDLMAVGRAFGVDIEAERDQILDPSFYLKLDEDFRDRLTKTK